MGTEETFIDRFSNELQSFCKKVPKYDVLVILGYLNVKLGKEEIFQDITGKHSLHEETSVNDRPVTQCHINDSSYEHILLKKDIFKGAWCTPGTNNSN